MQVPNLRFREFQEEWEEKSLNDLCSEFKSGKNVNSEDILEIGLYPVFGGNGLRGFSNKYNHDGIFVLIGRQGALCGNIHFVKGKCYITEHAIAVQANEHNHIGFLRYLLDKMNLGQYSDQSAQPGLAVNKLLKLNAVIPNLLEQSKIAVFLSLLDSRIETQIQTINNLQSLIKGLICSFVKNKTANVRLKDCLNCHSSTLMESAVIGKNGMYPVYGATGIIAHTPNYEIDKDAILIIKDGASVGKVQYAKDKYSVIGTLNYLTPKENMSLKYLYYYLQVFNFDKHKVGSGIPHIYFKDYGNEYIYCPPIERQNEIANLLSAIDEKLETEKQILKKYTEQKKYLLANMFI